MIYIVDIYHRWQGTLKGRKKSTTGRTSPKPTIFHSRLIVRIFYVSRIKKRQRRQCARGPLMEMERRCQVARSCPIFQMPFLRCFSALRIAILPPSSAERKWEHASCSIFHRSPRVAIRGSARRRGARRLRQDDVPLPRCRHLLPWYPSPDVFAFSFRFIYIYLSIIYYKMFGVGAHGFLPAALVERSSLRSSLDGPLSPEWTVKWTMIFVIAY